MNMATGIARKRERNQRTAIRTAALLRIGDYLRAGRGFSPIVRITADEAGAGLRLRLMCGVDRWVRRDEPVVIRASRETLRVAPAPTRLRANRLARATAPLPRRRAA